jgi:hypothetical protein
MKTLFDGKQQQRYEFLEEHTTEHVNDADDITCNPTDSFSLGQKSSALFFSVKRDIDNVLDLVAQVHRATKHVFSDPKHVFSFQLYSVLENLSTWLLVWVFASPTSYYRLSLLSLWKLAHDRVFR